MQHLGDYKLVYPIKNDPVTTILFINIKNYFRPKPNSTNLFSTRQESCGQKSPEVPELKKLQFLLYRQNRSSREAGILIGRRSIPSLSR